MVATGNLLDEKQVKLIDHMSRSARYRAMRLDVNPYPQLVKAGKKNLWYEAEVRAWLASRRGLAAAPMAAIAAAKAKRAA
jgi:predicted DNA-binding transcriptional regulator AlpA